MHWRALDHCGLGRLGLAASCGAVLRGASGCWHGALKIGGSTNTLASASTVTDNAIQSLLSHSLVWLSGDGRPVQLRGATTQPTPYILHQQRRRRRSSGGANDRLSRRRLDVASDANV